MDLLPLTDAEMLDIAEKCKEESYRNEFSDSLLQKINFISTTLAAEFHSDLNPKIILISRIIGNLCYNHETNRDRILQTDIIASLLSLLEKSTDVHVSEKLWSSTLNLTIDQESVQERIVDGGIFVTISAILGVILKENALIKYQNIIGTVIKVISNLVESGVGGTAFFETNIPEQLSTILTTPWSLQTPEDETGMNIWVCLVDDISLVIETLVDHQHHIAFAKSPLLHASLEFIKTDHAGLGSEDEVYIGTKLLILKQLALLPAFDEIADIFRNDKIIMQSLIEFIKFDADGWSEVIVNEIRMAGALGIGNLARSDHSCQELVQNYDVGKLLVDLIVKETECVTSDGIQSIKVLHAAVGALKNLSLCKELRTYLGDLGTIQAVVKLASLENGALLHIGIIGTIKNLCGDNGNRTFNLDKNCRRVILGDNWQGNEGPSKKTPLKSLVKLVWNDSKDGDGGVRNEGGRLIIQLIRNIHTHKELQFIPILWDLHAITLVVQTLTGAFLTNYVEAGGKLSIDDVSSNLEQSNWSSMDLSDHHVHFDAPAEMTKVFPVVQNESLLGLGLLASLEPRTGDILLKYSVSVLPILLGILDDIQDNVYSKETKVNALLLIKILIESQNGKVDMLEGFLTRIKSLKEAVEGKTKPVEQQLAALCSLLEPMLEKH